MSKTILCFVFAQLLLGSAPPVIHALSPGSDVPPAMADRTRTFLEVAGATAPAPLKVKEYIENKAHSSAVMVVALPDGGHLSVGDETGEVYEYTASRYNAPDPSELPEEERISAHEAFGHAMPILKYYALSMQESEYQIKYMDNIGSTWWIRKEFSYNEVPMIGRDITIVVTADTGRILSVFYGPPVIPKAVASAISQVDAISLAGEWAKKSPWSSPVPAQAVNDPRKTRKVIVTGLRHYLDGVGLPERGAAHEANFCWEVPIIVRDAAGRAFTRHVWIKMEDGTVADAN